MHGIRATFAHSFQILPILILAWGPTCFCMENQEPLTPPLKPATAAEGVSREAGLEQSPLAMIGIPPFAFLLTLALGFSAGLVAYISLFTPVGAHPGLLALPLTAGSALIHHAMRAPRPILKGAIHGVIMAGLFSLFALRFADPIHLYGTAFFQICAAILIFAPLPLTTSKAFTELEGLASMSRLHTLIKQLMIGVLITFLAFCVIALFEPLLQAMGLSLIENLWEQRFGFLMLAGFAFGAGVLVAPRFSALTDATDMFFKGFRYTAPVLAAFLTVLSLAMMSSGALIPGQETELFYEAANVNLWATILIFLGFGCLLALAVPETGALTNFDRMSAMALIFAMVLACLTLLAWSFVEVQLKGLTPLRGLALGLRLLFLAASILFAIPMFSGRPLQAALARSNQVFLIALTTWAALAMSPVINLHDMAASSQIAKLQAGQKTEVYAQGLRTISNTWGYAGQRVADYALSTGR